MGCWCTRQVENKSQRDAINKKVYSWDLRKNTNFNPENYLVENLKNEDKIKAPGSVSGHQFVIKNCQDSSIYVLDHMNTVTIDDCSNCKVVLGPVKGSVYIRDCTNCVYVVACGQLRIRDSRKIAVFVHCETQPVIEASAAIFFGSYQLNYKNINQHFQSANLDRRKQNWVTVHDFTPLESETNWKFIENNNAIHYVNKPREGEAQEKLQEWEVTWAVEEEICHTNSEQISSFCMNSDPL